MKIIPASYKIETAINSASIMRAIESAGRTCYKSEWKITPESANEFVGMVLNRHHESVIEHQHITVRFICDRGVSHELVRHRLSSYSQESTRYCNYASDKFGRELTFIKPCFWHEDSIHYVVWSNMMKCAEDTYLAMLGTGVKPQEARSVLPNSLKTEIVMTANLREWRHVFKLRCSK